MPGARGGNTFEKLIDESLLSNKNTCFVSFLITAGLIEVEKVSEKM